MGNKVKYLEDKLFKPHKDFLKQLKFRKSYMDDKSTYWYTRHIKTKMFGIIEIDVQDFRDDIWITVSMWDQEDETAGMFTAINEKYSKDKLTKIIGIFL